MGEGSWLRRVAGFSSLAFAAAYVAIIAVYVPIGIPPIDAEDWLRAAGPQTTAWWTILWLSVATDLMLIPIAIAVQAELQDRAPGAMQLGTAFVGLFVVLDLAVTWPNYAILIGLSERFSTAADEADRAALVAAATPIKSLLASPLEGVYSIATLAIGILVISLVMRGSNFGRLVAGTGAAVGVLGLLSVVGGLVSPVFGQLVVLASLLTTVWVFLVGRRLLAVEARR